MKFRLPSFIIFIALALTSCDGGNGRELSDYKDASTGDSLLYYYMQLRALEYWERATSDTTLRSPQQRQRFLEGVEKGISLITDDDNYNRGVRLGARLAYNLRDFEMKYGVDLDDGILLESLRNGLQDGKEIAPLENQSEFYRLLDKMKVILKDKQQQQALATLATEAKNRNLTKLSDNIYYKILRKGDGPMVKDGDIVNISIDYEQAGGENLGLPSPITITVGEEFVPIVMDRAYKMLNHGATAMFATTAHDLFGSRTPIMGLQDNDVVIVTLILNDIINPTDANHPGSANPIR